MTVHTNAFTLAKSLKIFFGSCWKACFTKLTTFFHLLCLLLFPRPPVMHQGRESQKEYDIKQRKKAAHLHSWAYLFERSVCEFPCDTYLENMYVHIF